VEEEPALARFLLTPTAGSDEVGQRDLVDRRPPLSQSGSRSGDAVAVAGGDTLAVDFRETLLAGLDEPRPCLHRPELVVLRQQADCLDPPHGRGRRPALSTLATSTVPLLLQPRGRRPGPNGFSLWALSGRPARPIPFAVATMRIGFEVGPRVGRQERTRAAVKPSGPGRAPHCALSQCMPWLRWRRRRTPSCDEALGRLQQGELGCGRCSCPPSKEGRRVEASGCRDHAKARGDANAIGVDAGASKPLKPWSRPATHLQTA
jgi:hypothetical protein